LFNQIPYILRTHHLLKSAAVFLFVILVSCEKETIIKEPETESVTIEPSNNSSVITDFLSEKEVAQLIGYIEKRTGKSVSKDGHGGTYLETEFGTIYLDHALRATDTLGKSNISFRIYPDDPQPRLTFSLVVGHASEGQEHPIYVIGLEKSEAYYEGEMAGTNSAADFSGKLHRYPIDGSLLKTKSLAAKELCEPVDVNPGPVPEDDLDDGGGNGGGGGGGNIGPGPGPAPGPGPGDGGGGDGGEDIYIEWQCGCEPLHNGGHENEDCTCENEDIIIIHLKESEPSQDASKSLDCPETDGPIGINLLEASLTIEENINSFNLDPCPRQILMELKKLQQNDIARILLKFGALQTTYDWEVKSGMPTNPSHAAETDWRRDQNDNAIDYDYLTVVKPSYVNQATRIAIARTLLHEMLHAYILSHIDDVENENMFEFMTFRDLWKMIQEDLTGFNNDPEPIHHEFMAQKFLTPIQDALKEWDESSESDDQYYEDLAWGALMDTGTFDHFHPIASESRNRIINTNNAEDNNSAQGGITPKGNPCQ